ncbi:MAG: hypothetical protein L0I76_13470 [Pseudonocardia sp.]|nr:hypothetical protein [Pseudonocardia sp.]
MSVAETAPPPAVRGVDPDALLCPGCHETAVCAPPSGWPERAGARPEFSHRDGSVLCPDGRGRVPEPVEATS